MKNLTLFAGAAALTLAGTSFGAIYDNGPLITHPGAGFGGADVSAVQNVSLGMSLYGFGHQVLNDNYMADDFTVTGSGWTINTFTSFGYQTGGGSGGSTINEMHLAIWDGVPGAGGNIIWGDQTTDILISSTWTGIFRTLEDTMDANNRAIMANVGDVGGLFLPAGTYYASWQLGGTLTSGPWAPPISILGEINTGNALQSVDGGVTWNPALDSGSGGTQGMPFLIDYVPAPGTLCLLGLGLLRRRRR